MKNILTNILKNNLVTHFGNVLSAPVERKRTFRYSAQVVEKPARLSTFTYLAFSQGVKRYEV